MRTTLTLDADVARFLRRRRTSEFLSRIAE
jgi:hypothetical protein